MRVTTVLTLIFSVVLISATVAFAAEAQTKCPVMGGKINKEVYVDYQGSRIYFCCPACMDKFKADPEKHLKKLKDQGVDLDDAPISGEDDSSREENN